MSEPKTSKKRGAPKKKHGSQSVKVRISDPAYDAYAVQSTLTGVQVGRLMRRVIEQHAPVIFRGATRAPEA